MDSTNVSSLRPPEILTGLTHHAELSIGPMQRLLAKCSNAFPFLDISEGRVQLPLLHHTDCIVQDSRSEQWSSVDWSCRTLSSDG